MAKRIRVLTLLIVALVSFAWSAFATSDKSHNYIALESKAKSGDNKAEFDLGSAFYDGEGVPKNVIVAIKWWRMAAQQGYAPAQAKLGAIYYKGATGFEKNDREAVIWMRKAANQNVAVAQGFLGAMYHQGEGGLQQDDSQAIYWWSKAAANGNASAQNNLGSMLHNGTGIAKDNIAAYMWFTIAAAKNNEAAIKNLNGIAPLMTLDQIKDAKMQANHWMKQHSNRPD